MKARFRARGIAAASLAFVSATSVPGPSGAIRASVLPSPILTAVASHGRTVDVPAGADAGAVRARPAPKVPETTAGRAHRASRGSIRLRRSLRALVKAHATTDVPDPERECLAVAVYFEAQGEPIEGQLAVAEVVLNRAASRDYPKSICEVVRQPAQFSFVRDGRFPVVNRRSVAWRKAVAVAQIAAEHLADSLAPDVLWYHADYVAPGWGRRLDRVTQIGAHIFYRSA